MGVDVQLEPTPTGTGRLTLDDVVDQASSLMPIPDVVHQIMRLARDVNAGTRQVALAVAKDPALSATMLRLANSSAYRAANPITDVPNAVTRLGIATIAELVLPLTVVSKPAGASPLSETIRKLMVASAASARVLARYTESAEPETLFLIGLLQDVGQMVLALSKDADYADVFERAIRDGEDLLHIEQLTYGFTHADVGERLAVQWDLPDVVVQGIRHHHDVVGAMATDDPNTSLNAAVTSIASEVGLALYDFRPRGLVSAEGLAGHNGQALLHLSDDILDQLWDECRHAAFELGAVFGM